MISIVIPNFNGVQHLKTCFDSLRKQTYKDYKIVLIDNNSSDDSINFTLTNYSEVEVVKMDYNTGFAKAVNEGIKHSVKNKDVQFIFLLNNDTECDENLLTEMVSGFKTNDTGSVACKMIDYNDRSKIDDAGDFIKAKGSPYARGYQEEDKGQYDKPEYIFGACAGAAMYKAEVFDKAGLFDEDFFAYYEDVDMSFRLQLMGYKCYYNPKAICYHKRGATTSTKLGFQTMLCEKNLIALRVKNYPMSILIKSLPFFLLVRVKRYLIFLFRHSPSLFFSAVKGYFKGLLELPKSMRKRPEIQKKKRVSPDYIESILR